MKQKRSCVIKEDLELLKEEKNRLEIELEDINGSITLLTKELGECLDHEKICNIVADIRKKKNLDTRRYY